MKRSLILTLLLLVINTLSLSAQSSRERENKVLIFDMREEIAPPLWHKMKKAFAMAQDERAALIIINMNTYGGMLETADSIRTKILNSNIPVYVFIDNNAASAGALISIACDSIYMVPGASMGAATVVNQTGEAVPDKYQSYMRSMMRATAAAKGRNPQIAEAMVDPRIVVPGVSDSAMVLTFTSTEAVKHGFCEAELSNIQQVVERSGIEKPQIIKPKYSWVDYVIAFFMSPIVSGLLIMLIIGGIYFELQTPGVGFPLLAAVIAAVLYFIPLYLEGLASHWEIIVFIIGIGLLLVEIFAFPGFGVMGVFGIVCIVAGLTLGLVDFSTVSTGNVALLFSAIFRALGLVVISATIGLFGSVFLAKKMLTSENRLLSRLALQSEQQSEEGYTIASKEYISMAGSYGLAFSDLRPSGKVEINGNFYEAQAISGYIKKGDRVKILRYEVGVLQVIKVEEKDMKIEERISVVQDDITTMNLDAIVNAANNALAGGGGVDGAIHDAAGEKLYEACAKLGGCKTGNAKITDGFDLPAKYIIHTVAPVWQGGLKGEPELLEQCYLNSLKLAAENQCNNIAFPNLGTGVFHYPKEKAAAIAIDTVKRWLQHHNMPKKVIFCCFDNENYRIYQKAMDEMTLF
jgi:membrane-bound serine protease (ClpP class)